VGHWSSRRVLQPVSRVADAAEALATGGLDTRLPPERDPDLQRLVGSFNGMADSIQARIEREARFASDVSHELRSPLAALAAASEVLSRRAGELTEPAQQALEIMLNQIGRFSTMVLDLLEISRIDAGMADVNLEPGRLGDLTERIVAASDHHDVKVEIAPVVAEAMVRLDRRRYERMLTNLLDNAAHYGAPPVTVRVADQGGRIAVHVDDAGPGVPAPERGHIFERFSRGSTAQQASGTGLGLALVREHARLHGAVVSVGESPEGGARFTLSFPQAAR
jgi:two-component system, OmpR family, sensor histidine kinase MtrB